MNAVPSLHSCDISIQPVFHLEERVRAFFSAPYAKKIGLAEGLKREIEAVRASDVRNPLVLLTLGEIALLEQDVEGAKRHFQGLLELGIRQGSPLESFFYSRKGFIKLLLGMPTASESLKRAFVLDNNDPVTLCCLSEALYDPEEDPDVRSDMLLQRAFTTYPKDPFVVFHYARRSFSVPEIPTRTFLEETAQAYPDDIPIQYLLGNYEKAARHPNALKNPYGLLANVHLGNVLSVLDSTANPAILVECLKILLAQGFDPTNILRVCDKIIACHFSLHEKVSSLLRHHPVRPQIQARLVRFLHGEKLKSSDACTHLLYLADSRSVIALLSRAKIQLVSGQGIRQARIALRQVEELGLSDEMLQPIFLALKESLTRLQGERRPSQPPPGF